MPNPDKIERVGELKTRIEGSDALLLAEYRGLTVAEITALRRSLAEDGTRLSVIKNTLMRRAAADAKVQEIEPLLEGPTAVAFVSGDPVAAAKRVVEAARRFPTLVLKGGYMDGHVLSADEAKALADLESREAMLSKIAGMVKAEMSRGAAMFASAQSKLLSLLEAYREKVPGGSAAAEEVAPAVEDGPEAEGGSGSGANGTEGDSGQTQEEE